MRLFLALVVGFLAYLVIGWILGLLLFRFVQVTDQFSMEMLTLVLHLDVAGGIVAAVLFSDTWRSLREIKPT